MKQMKPPVDLTNTVHPSTSDRLAERMVRGGAWVASLNAAQLGLGFLRTIILARILAPSDFGLFGMALLAMMILRVLTETGFQQALIHRDDVTDRSLDAAWSALFVRNTTIAVTLALGAGVVARFFEEPQVAPLLRVLSISILLEGFTSISVVLFEKHLEFRKRFVFRMCGLVAEFVTMVGFALIFRNVWALIVGNIVGAVVLVTASYAIGQRRPRFVFSVAEFRGLFGYGKWLTASSIIVFLLLYGGDILVGKLLGAIVLGYYQIGFRISNLPATALTSVLASVLFPALSSIKNQTPRVASLYVRSVRLTAVVTMPVTFLLVPLADLFTVSILGEKWLPAVPVIRFLAVFGLLRSLGGTTGPVFLALGRPDIRTKIQLVQLLIYAAVIFPLANRFGVTGVAIAAVVYGGIMNTVAIVYASRLCTVQIRRLAMPVFMPLLASAAACGIVLLAEPGFSSWPPIFALIALAASGVTVYLAALSVINKLTGGVYGREFHELLTALRK